MTVVPLDRLPAPDTGLDGPLAPVTPAWGGAPAADGSAPAPDAFAHAVSDALASASGALGRADAAERAFATHHGTLSDMVLERARADVLLSLASAATSRAAASLSTILGMQV